MCVVNRHFELIEFVFNSVYVDLKYNEISLAFTAWSVWCLWSYGRPWPVCEIVSVPYVGAVTVIRVLLFVLHVC